MSKYEWVLRCQRQFAKRTSDWSHDWTEAAEACFDTFFEGYPSSPEDAADEEMSYWD